MLKKKIPVKKTIGFIWLPAPLFGPDTRDGLWVFNIFTGQNPGQGGQRPGLDKGDVLFHGICFLMNVPGGHGIKFNIVLFFPENFVK